MEQDPDYIEPREFKRRLAAGSVNSDAEDKKAVVRPRARRVPDNGIVLKRHSGPISNLTFERAAVRVSPSDVNVS